MIRRFSFAFCGMFLVLTILFLSLSLARSTAGQVPLDEPAVSGRYHLALSNKKVNNKEYTETVVIDTTNGHCWQRLTNGEWFDLGSPIKSIDTIK